MINNITDLTNILKVLNDEQQKELENILSEDMAVFMETSGNVMLKMGEAHKFMEEDNVEKVQEIEKYLTQAVYDLEILRYKKIVKLYEFGKKHKLDSVLIKAIALQLEG